MVSCWIVHLARVPIGACPLFWKASLAVTSIQLGLTGLRLADRVLACRSMQCHRAGGIHPGACACSWKAMPESTSIRLGLTGFRLPNRVPACMSIRLPRAGGLHPGDRPAGAAHAGFHRRPSRASAAARQEHEAGSGVARRGAAASLKPLSAAALAQKIKRHEGLRVRETQQLLAAFLIAAATE